MKLIFFTDSHISAKTPISRKDNYQESIYFKLEQIINAANINKVDYIICGGDLFHSPIPTPNSVMIANNISKLLLTSKCPIYVVPGNHDQYGYNSLTLDKSLLGIYLSNNVVNILDRQHPLTFDMKGKTCDYKIAIEGQEYKIGVDRYNPVDFRCNEKAHYNILVAHAMLSDGLVSKYYKKNEVDCIDLEEVDTNANLILTGHEHNGYKPKVNGKTTFLNPGSLSRTETSLNHNPSFYFIQLDENLKLSYEKVKLNALDYNEIFDKEVKEESKMKSKLLDEFKKEISNINLNKTANTEQIIIKLASESDFNDELLNKTYKYMQEASEVNTHTNHVKKPYELKIKEVHLKNFQSHKDSLVKFSDGLNAILGMSDSGKTSVVRAIEWCLYNSIRGNEFIRTGEKECSVKVTFNDNSYIFRSRDLKSSGKYIVSDANGNIKEFEGFGNELPPEIVNEHQMPTIFITKDYSMNVNILKQLEGLFLLDKSSSVKANAVGKITNTDKIDCAIKNVSADKKNVQKDIKLLESQKLDKELELENYNNLEKEEKEIHSIDKLYNMYKEIKSELDYIGKLRDKFLNLNEKILKLEKEKESFVNIEHLNEKLKESKEVFKQWDDLSTYHSRLAHILNKISQCEKFVNDKINISLIKDKIDNANQSVDMIESYIHSKQSIQKLINNIKEQQGKEELSTNKIDEIMSTITIEKRVLDQLLDSLDLCPTCGHKIDEQEKIFIVKK